MREKIREIVVQAIAGTKDLTECIDELCVLSGVNARFAQKKKLQGKLKIKLPKSISYLDVDGLKNKYHVAVYSRRKSKIISVGFYNTIEEAVKERDTFIIKNYQGDLNGYLPRGISFDKQRKKYKAYLNINGDTTFNIGSYKYLDEAIRERNKAIERLK